MIDFKLSTKEIEQLERLHKMSKDTRIRDRIKCVVALGRGYSFESIKEILLIDERSARRYFSIYKEQGEDGLILLNYKGGIPKLTKEQEKELIKHLEDTLYSRAADIRDYIRDKYKVDYTIEGLVIMLHRIGFSYKKTKSVPAKANADEQKEFVEKYNELKSNLQEDETIFFMDAVHPTHNMMPSYAWIKTGKEKEVKTNTGRERVNINGVYNPTNMDVIHRKDDTINADSTVELLKAIEEKYSAMTTIYIICDNAKYYKSRIVQGYLETSKVKFIHLPSYSPNLNLIERLWKLFKKKVLYNKYYETKKEFELAIDYFFTDGIQKYKNEIKSLLVEKFHLIQA